MIISCTKCEKRFVVPDNAIPAEGRIVQCSACSNKWKQLPVKERESPAKIQPISVKKKRTKKRKIPTTPYSKDYMKQKWGITVQDYAQKEGLTKKSAGKKSLKNVESSGFGFFYYIITISIILLSFIGVLKLAESAIITQFPFLESYIDYFFEVLNDFADHLFETLDNFKIFISDFFR
jgi:predicted Zn finger-like uncharacterized protein